MACAPAAHALDVFGSPKVGPVVGLLTPAGLRGRLAGLAAFGLRTVLLGGAMRRARDKKRPAVEALAGGRPTHGWGKSTPAYCPPPVPRLPERKTQRGRRPFLWKGTEEETRAEEDPSAR